VFSTKAVGIAQTAEFVTEASIECEQQSCICRWSASNILTAYMPCQYYQLESILVTYADLPVPYIDTVSPLTTA